MTEKMLCRALPVFKQRMLKVKCKCWLTVDLEKHAYSPAYNYNFLLPIPSSPSLIAHLMSK
jgi:hypothetical protein